MSYTLCIIKYQSVQRRETGKIISILEENGFSIMRIKEILWKKNMVREFYIEHKNKAFYEDMCNDIEGKLSIAIIVKHHSDAILHMREIIGATNPSQASENTIRKLFGQSIEDNAIHASDSQEGFRREYKIIWNDSEHSVYN